MQGIAGIFTCTRQRERIYARHKGYARLAIQAGVGAAACLGACDPGPTVTLCAHGASCSCSCSLQSSRQACKAAPCLVVVASNI